MIQQTPQAEEFRQRMRVSFQHETLNVCTIQIAKHALVYTCGDKREAVYVVDSGQIKLLVRSPGNQECLLAILTSGDVFGEFSLYGLGTSQETAIALEETTLKQISCCTFIRRLSRDSLLEGFAQYLIARIAAQQQIIANLVMVDSEQQQRKTLLQLARRLIK